MKKMTFLVILVGLLLASSQVQADPQIQVIKLFDEHFMIYTGEVGDLVVRESTTVNIVRGAQDVAILSSTPDGTGIPNVDDLITINGEWVQTGYLIEYAVFDATGIEMDNPECLVDAGVSVNLCNFPRPHQHPIDVSDVIPVGRRTITVDIWDHGGGYGHTELYLIITPPPLQ